MYEQYGPKEMARDSKRAIKESKERRFYRKHFELGFRKEKAGSLVSALLVIGTVIPVISGSFV